MQQEQTPSNQSNRPVSESFEIKQLQIVSVYLKDLSFEVPYAPKIFLNETLTKEGEQPGKPGADIHAEIDCKLLPDDLAEVVFCLKATVKIGQTIAFIAEIHQAAVLLMKSNLDDERKQLYLKEVGVRILTPYVRETLSNLSLRGNFPPLFLDTNEFISFAPDASNPNQDPATSAESSNQ